MSSNLFIAAPIADGPGSDSHSSPHQNFRREAEPAKAAEELQPPADPGQRLVIEEIDGGLVYTVIDRATGAVAHRTSREEVTHMGDQPDYAAGALIRTTA